MFGSPGHNLTVNWIYDQLPKDYYDVYIQPFVETYSENSAKVFIDGVDQNALPFTYAPGGQINAPIVPLTGAAATGCNEADFPATVAGNIALIRRGTCSFGIKVANAGAAGAVAALVYNNANGTLTGTLGSATPASGKYVPAAALTLAQGEAILASTSQKTAQMDIVGIVEDRTTYNVIAETKGGDHNTVVMAGSHTDSVAAGPGINDNGSGSVSILQVAQQLAKFRTNNAVRFGWWSAEEFGLLGARHYVENLSLEEREKIRIYLNFDMLASENAVIAIYDGDGSAFNQSGPAGSAQMEGLFERYFDSVNVNHVPTAFTGRSDYGPFLDAGIAAGGLFTGADGIKTEEEARLFGGTAFAPLDSTYHRQNDTISNLNPEAFEINAKAIAHAIATLATSVEELGPKSPAIPPAARRRQHAHEEKSIQRCGEVLELL